MTTSVTPITETPEYKEQAKKIRLKYKFRRYARVTLTTLAIVAAGVGIWKAPKGYSDERTPGIGDAQYVALTERLQNMVRDDAQITRLKQSMDSLMQVLVVNPQDKQAQDIQADIKADYDSALVLFGTNYNDYFSQLLRSEGISERDAVKILKTLKSNPATRNIFDEYNSNAEDSGFSPIKYLDECQKIQAEKREVRTSAFSTDEVLACMRREDGPLPFMVLLLGGIVLFVVVVNVHPSTLKKLNALRDEEESEIYILKSLMQAAAPPPPVIVTPASAPIKLPPPLVLKKKDRGF